MVQVVIFAVIKMLVETLNNRTQGFLKRITSHKVWRYFLKVPVDAIS